MSPGGKTPSKRAKKRTTKDTPTQKRAADTPNSETPTPTPRVREEKKPADTPTSGSSDKQSEKKGKKAVAFSPASSSAEKKRGKKGKKAVASDVQNAEHTLDVGEDEDAIDDDDDNMQDDPDDGDGVDGGLQNAAKLRAHRVVTTTKKGYASNLVRLAHWLYFLYAVRKEITDEEFKELLVEHTFIFPSTQHGVKDKTKNLIVPSTAVFTNLPRGTSYQKTLLSEKSICAIYG